MRNFTGLLFSALAATTPVVAIKIHAATVAHPHGYIDYGLTNSQEDLIDEFDGSNSSQATAGRTSSYDQDLRCALFGPPNATTLNHSSNTSTYDDDKRLAQKLQAQEVGREQLFREAAKFGCDKAKLEQLRDIGALDEIYDLNGLVNTYFEYFG